MKGQSIVAVICWSVVVAIGVTGIAMAQDSQTDTSVTVLEPVVVTARKRSENLQEVPIAISVFKGEDLEKNHIDSLPDLRDYTPNFDITDNISVKTVYIRGVGGGGRNVGFDTRAGVFLDGVYIGTPPSLNAMLVDLDRVEILRGPQGYLFGQNTVSGAVSLITKAPSNELAATALTSYANRDDLRFTLMANVPINAMMFLKATFAHESRDGFMLNVFNGEYPNDVDNTAGRLQLRLQPVPNFKIDIAFDYAVQKSHDVSGEPRTDAFGTGPPDVQGPFRENINSPELDYNRNSGLSGTVTYEGDQLTFTSITAYRQAHRRWLVDLDHVKADWTTLDYVDDFETISQELRVATNDPARKLRYVAGVYMLISHSTNNRTVFGGSEIGQLPFLGIQPGQFGKSNPRVDSQSYAVYGSVDYDIMEGMTLNTGLRFTYVNKDLFLDQDPTNSGPLINFAPIMGYHDSINESSVSPTIGLTFELGKDAILYAKYARGSKSGGFNADFVGAPFPPSLRFKQETVDSFEVGLKTLWLDDRLKVNIAAFLNTYNDYQVSQFRFVNGIIRPEISNAGKARTYGPELSVTAIPVQGLTWRLDAAYLYATYASFKDGGGIGVDYTGNRLEYAPMVTASTSLDYSIPIRRGFFFARANYSYRSDQFANANNAPEFKLPSYALLSTQVGLADVRCAWGSWGISLFGENLTNKVYDLSLASDGLGVMIGRRGTPRSYGLQAKLTY